MSFLQLMKLAADDRVPSMKEWFKPYPHQAEAVDKLFSNHGKLILAHQTGTGKTATAVYGFEKMKHHGKARKALVVVPSGLRDNFATEGVGKFVNGATVQVVGSSGEVSRLPGYVRPTDVAPDKDYTVVSYSMFRRDPEGIMQRSGADTLIMDEFHKVRNEKASVYKAALRARQLATNFIGLTASPVNNKVTEIATLLTVSEGKRLLSPKDFRNRYQETVGFSGGMGKTRKPVRALKNVNELMGNTLPRVSYVETKDLGKDMPAKVIQQVDVPMSKDQWGLYELAMDKLGPMREFLMRRDETVTLKDAQQAFTRLTQARQVSNSVHMGRSGISLEQAAEQTPKVKRLLEDARKHLEARGDNKVVLYSNLVNGGVDVLSAGLRRMGIDHGVFVGKGSEINGKKITGVIRQEGVREYKAGKKRAIILSGAGAEGLDLRNSTAFYSLDGHFNPQRVIQAEARAVRLKGLSGRPEAERKVDVRRYRSVRPATAKPGFFSRMLRTSVDKTPTVDEWTYDVAGRKFKAQQEFFKKFKQHKYLRKYTDSKGKTRYVYGETTPKQPTAASNRGLLGRLSGYFFTPKQRTAAQRVPAGSVVKPTGVKGIAGAGSLPKLPALPVHGGKVPPGGRIVQPG